MTQLKATLLGMAATIGVGFCPPAATTELDDPAMPGSARREAGRKIYNFRCYYCHGYSGDAKTTAATHLSPPPRAFVTSDERTLPRHAMIVAVNDGKPGTAMKGFAGILSMQEIELVVDFVREEFMREKRQNTHYHTAANGWPAHERNREAFPFVSGDITIDVPWAQLTPEQQRGKRLYITTCVSCHDRPAALGREPVWEARPLSFPRNRFQPGQTTVSREIDAVTSASPYRVHDSAPKSPENSPTEKRGERIFQKNCAFCHSMDGTGNNWIGSFLEPHPRNLTDRDFMSRQTMEGLAKIIRDGVPNTSMPAWRNVLRPDEVEAVVCYISQTFGPIAR